MAIVLSHIADDFDTLARRAQRQAPLSDVVELRLDRIGHPGEGPLRELIAAIGKPVIVTVHGAEAFGDFAGSVDERLDLLADAARAGAAFVDVDWTLSLELGEVEGKCHRIVSRHDAEGTPEDLATFDEEVREVLYEGDVVKLVTHAASTEDGLRMLRWLRAARGGLVAFCSGAAGSFTRVLGPVFGSPFTYAASADLPGMDPGPLTAPGQIRVNDLLAMLPPGGISQETAIFAVVGEPLEHSLSPWVQGMALKSAHLDAVFVALPTPDLEAFLALADDENFRGLAVTAPHKEAAFRIAKMRDGASERVRACNTLVRDGDGWRGFNTDVPAVRETLERAFELHARTPGRPAALAAARALVLGTGGAARAAVGALRELGVDSTVAGRDAQRAGELATELECEAIAWDDVPSTAWDVLVHCTPVGTGEDGELVVPAEWLREGTLVLDAVYRPIRTPLLAAALGRDCTAVPGGEWFVRQASAQFQCFTHQEADEDLMRAAFENALGLAPSAPA